jgi:hypothetical protein
MFSDKQLVGGVLFVVGVPLFFVLLQYYGFPLLDRLAVFCWRGLRTRIAEASRKRREDYERMVQGFVNDTTGYRAILHEAAGMHRELVLGQYVIMSLLCMVLLAIVSVSLKIGTGRPILETLLSFGVLLLYCPLQWMVVRLKRATDRESRAMKEALRVRQGVGVSDSRKSGDLTTPGKEKSS